MLTFVWRLICFMNGRFHMSRRNWLYLRPVWRALDSFPGKFKSLSVVVLVSWSVAWASFGFKFSLNFVSWLFGLLVLPLFTLRLPQKCHLVFWIHSVTWVVTLLKAIGERLWSEILLTVFKAQLFLKHELVSEGRELRSHDFCRFRNHRLRPLLKLKPLILWEHLIQVLLQRKKLVTHLDLIFFEINIFKNFRVIKRFQRAQ